MTCGSTNNRDKGKKSSRLDIQILAVLTNIPHAHEPGKQRTQRTSKLH